MNLEERLREWRLAVRVLARSPRSTGSLVATLGIGGSLAVGLLALALGGLSHPEPVEARPGVVVPGGGEERTTAEFSALERFFGAGRGWQDAAMTVPEVQRESLIPLLRTLGAIALLALAVSSIHLLLLHLARAVARGREMAVRAAVGGTPRDLIPPLLREGAVLAAAGAVATLILAAAGVALLRITWPEGLAPWLASGIPPAAALVGLGVPLLLALALAAVPAAGSRTRALQERLGAGERAASSPAEARLRRRLGVGAVAAAVVLLVGAGVLLRGFGAPPSHEAIGFDPSDTLTFHLELPAGAVEGAHAGSAQLEAVLERLSGVSGVEAASVASAGAWMGVGTRDLAHAFLGPSGGPGAAPPVGWVKPVRYHAVAPGYFRALGIPVRSGRELTPADRRGAEPVVVIDEIFAHRLFPGVNPVGKRVQLGGMSLEGEFYTVVGVVARAGVAGLGAGAEPEPALYLSALQLPPPEVGVAVRTTGDPMRLLPRVEAAVRSAWADASVVDAMTMQERIERFQAPVRWLAWIFATAALLAALLASFGVYGVISDGVSRRTREIGVRMALGADAGDVTRLVLREGLGVAAAGLAWGVAGGLCLGRLLQSLFAGVDLLDPGVFAMITALIGSIALIAAWIPARSTAALDPAVALRAP